MPVCNAQEFICETIDSVLSQTISDWELIIINDFSEDISVELISEYARRDKRIKLNHNYQKGIIPAFSMAFSQSKGKYITRMDADDIMPENKLKLLYNCVNQNPKTVATGKVKYFSRQPVSEGFLRYEDWLNEIADKNKFGENIYRECVIASPNWMVHRSCFENDISLSDLNYPEDYDLVLKWYDAGYEFKSINEITHLWREHPARTSRNSEVYQQKSFFELKTNHFINREIQDKENVQLIGYNQKGKLVHSIFEERNIPIEIFEFNADMVQGKFKNVTFINNSFKTILTNWPADKKTQGEISQFLLSRGFEFGKNIWLF
ncbi:MAG: glycosyltransferase family 2 protein [Crocinitomicaceae bacterium]|nr:glycosyltransferase family 2 protein [Crocinitomicaceae bacterium]